MGEMQSKSDAQLLREYAENGAESSFAELVQRHTNLIYSAALRQVESPDTAAEISQRVFIDLAKNAAQLTPKLAMDASLAGWLCRSARNLSLNARRDEFRRQSRERQAMEQMIATPDSTPDWEQLRLVLDDAMSELTEADYDALVLRFYNNQDLRSVGVALGVSDDTAQKRVSRALEKLREQLSRRNITTTTATLSLIISANAVHAAPVGLAASITTAAALTGAATLSTASATIVKTVTMTTLQKAVIATVLVAGITTPFVLQQQAQSKLRAENTRLLALNESLLEQADNTAELVAENERLSNLAAGKSTTPSSANNSSNRELLRLRGEVGRLRMDIQTNAKPADAMSRLLKNPAMMESIHRDFRQTESYQRTICHPEGFACQTSAQAGRERYCHGFGRSR